ncbi:MAG: glycosyltransferase family 9 protein [Candidatus Omnitrophota bacterium]
MPKRILIINPFGVGDVLFSTPLISCLKKTDPGLYIAYICNIRTKELLETNPEIDEVFVFERDHYRALWKKNKLKGIKKLFSFWSYIKKNKFDMAIDLSLGKEYAFFCWLIGIKERIGFDYKSRGLFLTEKIAFTGFNDKLISEYYLDTIRSKIDLSRIEGLKTTIVTSKDDKGYIDDFLKSASIEKRDLLAGIMPGGGESFGKDKINMRRWSVDKFSRLADRMIKELNAKVVLMWAPGEEGVVEQVKNIMKENVIISPKTTLRQMAELCSRCSVVVCSEGGPLHIASSQAVPTVSMFGPVDDKVYGPYPPGDLNRVITRDIECRPCYKRFKVEKCEDRRCLKEITADEVFSEVSDILKHGGMR